MRTRLTLRAEKFPGAEPDPIAAHFKMAKSGSGFLEADISDFNFAERVKLQFRAEATNAFNIVNLNNPVTSRNSSQLGQVRDARTMCEMQLGLRLTF